MLSDITIGQYFPGKSVVHNMDARMKILLTMVLIVLLFLSKNFYSLALMILFVLLTAAASKISLKTIIKGVKPIGIIIVFTAVINLFYGEGEPLFTVWKFSVTTDGIFNAIFTAARIIILVISGSLLTYTTTPTDLTDAMERLLKPLKYIHVDVHVIAMTMTIALRFIPTLIEETEKITDAQKSRGADIGTGGLVQRIKALLPILIPLFISSFRRASELAYAMECRCYRGGEGRTKMKTVKMRKRDYLALLIVCAAAVLVFILNGLAAPVL